MQGETLWFLALIVAVLVLAGLNFLQVIWHYREKKDIFERYMARDLQELEYFRKEYPGAVEHKEKIKEEQLENMKKMTPAEVRAQEMAKGF